MITVGSRDARKVLGLGFGVEREMDDTELEEGEACSYRDDASVDPDVALSYIDEKIHNVLGHFQKDFEGGVSAENLGAKFGGYGSFLPSYQRSPVWSHPRTPPKIHHFNSPESPKSLQPEIGHHNSVVRTSAPLPGRHGPATTNNVTLPATKAPSVHDSSKRDMSVPHTPVEGFISKSVVANKSAHPPEQKSLKVRIKVGSDNLSTQKNAAIYSGLGLDVSPSSSLEDSPTESEGLSRAPQESPEESPNSILQTMTSFPVHGSILLSPLPDSLVRMTKKEKVLRGSSSDPVPEDGHVSSVVSANASDSGCGDWRVSGKKKTKATEFNGVSSELRNQNSKDAQSSIAVTLKKESDIDTLACEELVSNALKLPLMSTSYGTGGDPAKVAVRVSEISRDARKDTVKDEFFSDIIKEESLEQACKVEVGWVEKPTRKAGSAARVGGDREGDGISDVEVYQKRDGNRNGEKSYESGKADSDAFKGRSALNAEIIDPLKLKSDLKATSQEQNRVPLLPGKEHSSSGGKKKSKGSRSHNTVAAETPKESLRVSSSASKTKKSIPDENNTTKTESENLKLQKDSRKARDPYKDFFGDISLEQEEIEEDSMDLPSKGRVKDPEVNETGRFASNNESNERLSEKKIEKPWTTEAYPKAVSNVAPFTGNGPISDAAPSLGPIDSKDNWVCCDKCQKWRLLPFGTNPDNLPEKWLCSMQKWLPPGMNRCSFSEDETTRALYALYQAPPSETQNNLRGHPDGNVLGVHPAGAGNPDQNKHNVSSRAVPNGVKKKHELKEMSDATNQVVPTEFPGFVKNLQPSVKSRSLNEVNQSPLVNEADLQQSKSSDLATEKQRNKKKEKHQSLEQYSDGGSMKNLKIKNKRESDQDGFRTSKKTKKEVKMHTDDDWMSDIGGAIRKPDLSSTSGLPTDVVGKDQSNHTDRSSSKDSKCDRKDDFQVSAINLKEQVLGFLDNGDVRRQDNKDSIAKKRKVKECEDNQISSESLPSTEYDRQRSRVSSKEEESENDHRKEKKAKVPRYDGKESILSKGNGRTDKKSNLRKDQQLGQDLDCALAQRSLDGVDSFKRDLVSSQPVAATSSSSKVSGSHKSKTNFQEVKGSPVESVSSSPMRVSNTDKLRGNLVEKEDPQDTGFFTRGSPRRYSDGEDDGGSDRSGTGREDKSFIVNNHRSLESTVLDFHDRELNHLSGSKIKAQTVASPEITNRHYTNGNADTSGQYTVELQALDRCHDEERRNDGHYYANGSSPRKSGKGSSSRLKDKNRGSRTEYDKHKNSDSFHASQAPPNEEKTKDSRNKFQEKSGVKPYKVEKKYADKRDSAGKFSSESSKRESQSKSGGHGNAGAKVGVTCSQDAMRTPKQNMLRGHDGEKSPKAFFSDKTDRAEVISVRGKSVPLPPSGRGQNEPQAREHRQVPVSHKGNGASTLPDDASEGENAFKGPKQTRQVENETGGQKINLRHATPNGPRVRDLDAPSPVRKDSSSQAATNAVKEAKNLKHLADRLKNSGSNLESTGFYFQAALKFLYGASLLESSNSESSKHGEAYQSMQIYSSTAKLCEFCAHEFERSKDMAAASLAYKCMEVAYMRVTYFSHTGASRDRHELQQALQMAPPGESPSSSASDVDNLNNVAVDKVSLAKGVSSPQVAGNHVISARNRPNFVRLLNFAQDVNFAMEASRKSRMAFAAASITLEETQQTEGISSIKRALDFNFQDVEGLLQLVRIAMDAISH